MKYIHPLRYYRYVKTKWLSYLMKYHPKNYADYLYKQAFGHGIYWKQPRDLNEWINYLTFKTDTSQWSRLADKYEVRKYVSEKGLSSILLKSYGKWMSPDDIDFDRLPDSFAVKTNCGCGDTIIVEDKSKADFDVIRELLRKALANRDKLFLATAEPHYLKIKQLIVSEELIPSAYRTDYKVWCFNGCPFGILTCSNRDRNTHHLDLAIYDLDWKRHDEWLSEAFRNSVEVNKPAFLDNMIEYAIILSDGFPQVRVDFYETPKQVYFGEMTFTSYGGRMNYFTPEILRVMGEKVKIGMK